MQMAYITYATIASGPKIATGDVERSRWADQVTEAANHHARTIEVMRKGQYYDTLKDDPRLSKKADEKVSLADAPYNAEALKSQKTRLADESTRSIPMPKAAQKFVNKFVEKAKAMHAEKDAAAAAA
jgi:hypothetical protein